MAKEREFIADIETSELPEGAKKLYNHEVPSIPLFTHEIYDIDKYEFGWRIRFTIVIVITCLFSLTYFMFYNRLPMLRGSWTPVVLLLATIGVIGLGFFPQMWKTYEKYTNAFAIRGTVVRKYVLDSRMIVFRTKRYMITVLDEENNVYLEDVICSKTLFNKLKCGSRVLATCRENIRLKAWPTK
ncbi:MAG: hypothetical protein ACI4KF_10680 [Huintestinicola sp.]